MKSVAKAVPFVMPEGASKQLQKALAAAGTKPKTVVDVTRLISAVASALDDAAMPAMLACVRQLAFAIAKGKHVDKITSKERQLEMMERWRQLLHIVGGIRMRSTAHDDDLGALALALPPGYAQTIVVELLAGGVHGLPVSTHASLVEVLDKPKTTDERVIRAGLHALRATDAAAAERRWLEVLDAGAPKSARARALLCEVLREIENLPGALDRFDARVFPLARATFDATRLVSLDPNIFTRFLQWSLAHDDSKAAIRFICERLYWSMLGAPSPPSELIEALQALRSRAVARKDTASEALLARALSNPHRALDD